MISISPPGLLGLALAGAASAVLLFVTPVSAQAVPRFHVVGHFSRADLGESSGIAASRRQPGVYWTVNDSGGEPAVYAFDLNGRDLGSWTLPGATNQDWEALAIGPCGDGQPGECLYVGDVGDNAERRPTSTIYRVSEPIVTGRLGINERLETGAVERLDFTYDDGPHDVEAIYTSSNGSTWLITKGRSSGIRAFELDTMSWRSSDGLALARARSKLPITPDMSTGRVVTDSSLSLAGSQLAVRTYNDLMIFDVNSETGELNIDSPSVNCDLRELSEQQGEGVGWLPAGNLIVLASEGYGGQISTVDCVGS